MSHSPYDIHSVLFNAAEQRTRRRRASGTYPLTMPSTPQPRAMEHAFKQLRKLIDAGVQPSIPVDSPQTGYVFIQLEGYTEAGILYGTVKPGQEMYMSDKLRNVMTRAADIPDIVPVFYIYPNGTFSIRLAYRTA